MAGLKAFTRWTIGVVIPATDVLARMSLLLRGVSARMNANRITMQIDSSGVLRRNGTSTRTVQV